MRTRRQARLLVANEDDVATGSLLGDSPVPEETTQREPLIHDSPVRKRRNVKKVPEAGKKRSTKAGNKGKLAGVLSLPIEAFTEIASYLAPPDVLALSRLNKFFHNLLMHRSAQQIWRVALQNVPGLPPCPPDLCEPQYVALLYSKNCSMCGALVVKPMEPYLNVRLCNICRKDQIISPDSIEDKFLEPLIPQTLKRFGYARYCLRSDKERIEAIYNIIKAKEKLADEDVQWVTKQVALCITRLEHGAKLETFLENMAETRAEELESLKDHRRKQIKKRLEEAGWNESDWTFPSVAARKWAPLVEGAKPLTDRVWRTLYPKLVPWLEKNRQHHIERLEVERREQRQRRLRRLLLEIKHRNVLLEVEKKIVKGGRSGQSDSAVNDVAPAPDLADGDNNEGDDNEATGVEGEHGASSSDDDDSGYDDYANFGAPAQTIQPTMLVLRRPFPPMVDALALPIISELLDEDVDVDTLGENFEQSRGEIEDVLWSWSSTVEDELAGLLKPRGSSDSGQDEDAATSLQPDIPKLDLGFTLPADYAHSFEQLSHACRLLLRADSVFRVADDNPSPLPLYYPELFSVFRSRDRHYFDLDIDIDMDDGLSRIGYTWKTSNVLCYTEGIVVAKALLHQLGRPDATQFELQALGPRFSCGLCPDKWLRTWNEIVHHYAEALVHARLAKAFTGPAKKSVSYVNVHSLDSSARARGKNKPLVILRAAKEAKMLRSNYKDDQMMVRCLLCRELGISFLSPRDTMVKHVRAVHAIKTPKAEHYQRTYEYQGHVQIRDGLESVSGSSSEAESVDDVRFASMVGPQAYWTDWKHRGRSTVWDEAELMQ